MTVRAPKRRDHVAVVSAQPVPGRRVLLQRAGLAIIDIVLLAWLSLVNGLEVAVGLIPPVSQFG